MKKLLHPLMLVPLTALATAGVVMLPAADAQQAPVSPAPELVTGLPDFTRLVDRVGPGVVSVEARIASRRTGGMAANDQMDEMLRRFGIPLPPGMQGPRGGMPEAPRGISMGTGFLISADGYVLTNHHVVDNAEEVTVKLGDTRELKAKVVGSDAQSDVALLKVEANNLPALPLGNSSGVRPGQWVVAIGSPYGLDHSVTAGIVSAVGRNTGGQQYVPFIQTDVAINRGNSGGPLLNTRGEVVGINSQIFSVSGGYQGISFAIPIDTAMNAVQQLKATGEVRRGMLGVNMQSIDSGMASVLKLPDSRGALVSNVQTGSAAEKAGLRPQDVIRSFNGAQVRDAGDLAPMVGALPPGAKVKLGVWRDGRERTVDVILGEPETQRTSDFSRAGAQEADRPDTQPTRGLLGLRMAELDADDRRQLKLRAGEGVGVVGVESMAAREAGIMPGDVILAIGNTTVGSASALQAALAGVKAGQTVMLRLSGRGGTRFVTLKAGG